MRKPALLLLGPIVGTCVLLACDETPESGGGGEFTFDAGSFDGATPPPPDGAGPDAAAPDVDAGPAPVTVAVVSGVGAPKAGVAVVWHDATGAVLSTSTTDATGRAVSSGPTPAMATALLGKADARTEAITWTGVAAGDTLLARDNVPDFDVVATYAVTMPAPTDQALTLALQTAGCRTNITPDSVNPTLDLTAACAKNPSSLLAVAEGEGGTALEYAFKKGNVPTLGGTANVTTGAWAAPTDVTVAMTNVSLGADFFAQKALVLVADGQGFDTVYSTSTGPFNATFATPTGFADAMQPVVYWSYSNSGTHALAKRAAPGTAFTVDYGDRLPEISNATIDTTTRKRPKIDWSAASALSAADGGSVSFTWYVDETMHGWTIIVPPSGATGSVIAPALPASAAAWTLPDAPDGAPAIEPQPPQVLFGESDLMPGYAEWRAIAGGVLGGASASDRWRGAILPKNGTLRVTAHSLTAS